MEELVLVMAFYVVVISLFFTIMLCGENSRFLPLRRAHACLTGGLCSFCVSLRKRLFGERGNAQCSRIEGYFFRSRNPVLAIFYLVLVWGGVLIFCLYVWPYIPNPHIEPVHNFLIPVAILLPNMFFVLAMRSDPGFVTKASVSRFVGVFPYDNIVFFPKPCTTCDITRPARTKHCSLCGHCVSRYDHHCAWVNNCIGEYNIKYFLGFLFSTASLCAYGAMLSFIVLIWIIEETELFSKFVRGDDGEAIPVGWSIAFRFMMAYHSQIMGLAMFMAIIAVVLYAFFFYHCYLIWRNTTTAEGFKWADAARAIGYWKWRQDQIKSNQPRDSPVLQANAMPGKALRKRSKQSNNSRASSAEVAAGSAAVRKPASQMCLGEILASDNIELTDEEIMGLNLPDILRNPYDRGLAANFREVISPPSLVRQRQAMARRR